MGAELITYATNVVAKLKSRHIVTKFIADHKHRGVVNWESTGRTFDQVYNGLFQYVDRHPSLGVRCVREDGTIVLYNDSVGEGG